MSVRPEPNTPPRDDLVPPHDLEMEQSVLGGVLLRSHAMDDLAGLLTPEDFYRVSHSSIYKAMLELYEKREPIDLVTVSRYLKVAGLLEQVGGPVFLAALSEHVGTASNTLYYARQVVDLSDLRRFQASLMEATHESFGRVDDVATFIDQAEAKIFARRRKSIDGARSFEDLVPQEMMKVEERFEHRTNLLGIPTGLTDLDKMICGFEDKALYVVAARPGMGKTALGLSFAEHAADKGYPVGFFSMEMGQEQLVQRAMAHKARIPFTKVRTGQLVGDEWSRLQSAAANLSYLPIVIDDAGSLTPLELRARARRMVTVNKVRMIVVDYLQLMHSPGSESRNVEISRISASLKALSKELAIPIIALSQLSRAVESRKEKRPELSDLRDSGSIEQDADTVLFIFRESVYNDDPKVANTAELLVKKQRNGPLGTIDLYFNDQFVEFASIAKDEF